MFPTDALTISAQIPASTASTTVLAVPPGETYTFLNSDLHQAASSQDPQLSCGNVILNKAYGNADYQSSGQYKCTTSFIVKSGNNSGNIFYSFTYVPRDISASTSVSTTTPRLVYTFTAGDVVISFFLLCVLVLLFARFTFDSL